MSATVQQTASTVADLNGKLGAQWGVKVNTSSGGNNYVAGIQLGIDGSGQSQFLVQADTFGVYVPNGDQKIWSSVSTGTALIFSRRWPVT